MTMFCNAINHFVTFYSFILKNMNEIDVIE
jgi:hypothetical protein